AAVLTGSIISPAAKPSRPTRSHSTRPEQASQHSSAAPRPSPATPPAPIDTAMPLTVATESTATITASWTTTGFSATSLALNAPTTLRTLPASEVYRLNVIWTLSTGPQPDQHRARDPIGVTRLNKDTR